MQQTDRGEFGIDEARRVLGEVLAPWVRELNLSVERLDHSAEPAELKQRLGPQALGQRVFLACRERRLE